MSTADGSILGTTQVWGAAPRGRAFNIVLLAEGFTAEQQNDFDTQCAAFVDALRTTPPFDRLMPAINVFRVNVSSTDSGADDPLEAGGSGTIVATYFDASFGSDNIRRLLVCNSTTALTVANGQVPEFTVVLVLVNSTVYGGSGGAVATYSLAAGATEIALHEMGHSAFGLADEYAYLAGDDETGHDEHPDEEPNEPNVTTNTVRATLKWRGVVDARTELPTMSNPNCAEVDSRPSAVPDGTVGLFEGAHYYHCGAYRPEYTCKMQRLGVAFCRVCRDVISGRIAPLIVGTSAGAPVMALARFPHGRGLDIWVTGSDRHVYTAFYHDDQGAWNGWHGVAGAVPSGLPPGAPVMALARFPDGKGLDIWVTGNDGHVYTAFYHDDQGAWNGWHEVAGVVPSGLPPGVPVMALARFADGKGIDTWVTANDRHVYTASYHDHEGAWNGWHVIADIVP